MKKKIFMLATVATLAVVMTACGSAQTSNNPTPTVEPTKVVEATTAPTATSTPTPEPTATSTPTPEPTATSTPTPEPTATSTPTPEPTATSTPTPEPTSTPAPTEEPTEAPTSTPEPTEAPVAETKDWATVLVELHSLATYEEREAYVEGLDASMYEVTAMDNFEVLTKSNWTEGADKFVPEHTVTYDTALDGYEIPRGVINQGESYYGNPTGEHYLMTLTNLATGETDPWGAIIHAEYYSFDPENMIAITNIVTYTVEQLVELCNTYTEENNSEYHDYEYVEWYNYIKTWDTRKYYAE